MKAKRTSSAINDLTQGPLVKQLLLFALPLMGANLLHSIYNLVDLWVIGQYESSVVISAVSISGQLVTLLYAVGIGLGNGSQILIAQQVGAKDLKRLNTTIGTTLSICMLCSLVVAAAGAVGANLWLDLLQTPAEAMHDAVVYLLICCIGVPFTYGGGTLCAILRGLGDSKTPMIILVVSCLTNVVLNVLFVAAFGMGAAGVAIATVLAQVVTMVFGFAAVYRRREALGFDFKPASFRMHGPTLKVLVKLSVPLIITQASITFSMMVVTAFVNAYGVAASALTGIGSKVNSIIGVVTTSMQTATSSMVAQNFAAGNLDRVRKINRVSNLVCILFFVVVGTIVLLFPVQIIGIFTQPNEVEVLSMARSYMGIAFWLYLAFCLLATPLGHINGVGFTTLNLVISLLDGVIGRIGLSYLFGNVMNMGVEGYWWGNAISAYISVILGFIYYFFGKWTKRELLMK